MAKKKKGRVVPNAAGLPGAGVRNPAPQITASNPYVSGQNPYTASAPPIDPSYEAYKVSAGRNTALADADATYQGARIENQYGLGSDTSNPYSQAKLLEENWRRSTRGTTGSYANQGQLYSGAAQVAQGENQRNYSMGYDQISRGYQDAKYGNARSQVAAYASNVTGVDDAKYQSLLRALGGS